MDAETVIAAPPAKDGERSYAALLAVPSLVRLVAGMHVSRIAQQMTTVALVLFTLAEFGSPPLAGLVAFAAGFPVVLAGPIAGALLDRHGRTRLIVLDYAVAGTTLVVIALLSAAGRLTPALLVALAAASALTGPLSLSGARSLLPLMVPTRLWERVNALDSAGYVVATVVGPPAAGILVQLAGPRVALASICAVFLVAAACVAHVREPSEAGAGARARDGLWREAWQGIVYTWRNRTLRGLAFAISTANVTWGMTTVAVPLIVLDRLHGGPAAVGAAFAVQGIGGIVAAVLVGRLDSRGRERRMLVGALLGTAAALALLVPDAGAVPVALALALVGLLNGPIDVSMFTLRQRRTDTAWIGRAFAVSMSINFLGMPVGAALTGALATAGVGLAVALAIVCSVVAAVLAQWLIPAGDSPLESEG